MLVAIAYYMYELVKLTPLQNVVLLQKAKTWKKIQKQRQRFFSAILEESEWYRDVFVKLESASQNTNLMTGVFCQALK